MQALTNNILHSDGKSRRSQAPGWAILGLLLYSLQFDMLTFNSSLLNSIAYLGLLSIVLYTNRYLNYPNNLHGNHITIPSSWSSSRQTFDILKHRTYCTTLVDFWHCPRTCRSYAYSIAQPQQGILVQHSRARPHLRQLAT